VSADDPHWPRASAWLASGGATDGLTLALVGIPLSRTSISPSQAHLTPMTVRAALRRFSTFHAGLDVDLETVRVVDHGDLHVADATVEDHLDRIDLSAVRADLVVVLGGDNAITRPAMRTVLDVPTSGLLTLDAHHDVRDFHAGASNGTPVRGLLDDGLPGTHVVQLGLGMLTNSRHYRTFCEDNGVTVRTTDEIRGRVREVVRSHLDGLAATCPGGVYVDLDFDVVDSAFVPGCPGARPGGLLPHELLAAAEEAGRHPAVRAVDLTEVDAGADPDGRTVDLMAQCLLSVAAGLARRGPASGTPPGGSRPTS
jgi:formiminoglutamase